MDKIKLGGLDFERMKYWINQAEEKQATEPIYSFILIWIGFNYYYGTFVVDYEREFISWANTNFSGSKGDKAQLFFLVNQDCFSILYSKFKEQSPRSLDIEIKLPIINMIDKTKKVPSNYEGLHNLKTLSIEDIFNIVYQIRNNLFHGSKNIDKSKRDKELSKQAAKFMIPFLNFLFDNSSN